MMVARKSGLVVNVSSIGGLNHWVNAGKIWYSTHQCKMIL